MLKQLFLFFAFTGAAAAAQAQELYVYTEPASNMAANSLGVRVTNRLFPMDHADYKGYRLQPEVMFGFSKKLMVHASTYFSNMMQKQFEFEGASVYAKYRFISLDEVQSHFRMAAFVKGSLINNPYMPPMRDHDHTAKPYNNEELDLDGGSSGVSAGIIATQLLHKLALSGTVAYDRYMRNTKDEMPLFFSKNALNYSLSAGYLLFPRKYKNYKQTNVNLYVEFLGKSNLDRYRRNYYVDAAPAVQLIINSNSRVDFGYRWQLYGDMDRVMDRSFLLRYEFNFYNIRKQQ